MLCLAELSAHVWYLINVTDSGWVTQLGMSFNQVDLFFLVFIYFQYNLKMQYLWRDIVTFYIHFLPFLYMFL